MQAPAAPTNHPSTYYWSFELESYHCFVAVLAQTLQLSTMATLNAEAMSRNYEKVFVCTNCQNRM
jgi:hypothetical protein